MRCDQDHASADQARWPAVWERLYHILFTPVLKILFDELISSLYPLLCIAVGFLSEGFTTTVDPFYEPCNIMNVLTEQSVKGLSVSLLPNPLLLFCPHLSLRREYCLS